MARSAGLDWIPNLSSMNGYRNLGTYYGSSLRAAVQPESRADWPGSFDDRVDGDEAAAAWVRSHGLSGHSAVVWSNEVWVYLLADLPLMMPTAPIYNNFALLGQNGQVSARVRELNPEIIVTSDDAVLQFPEVKPVLHQYREVFFQSHISVWLRNDVPIPDVSPT